MDTLEPLSCCSTLSSPTTNFHSSFARETQPERFSSSPPASVTSTTSEASSEHVSGSSIMASLISISLGTTSAEGIEALEVLQKRLGTLLATLLDERSKQFQLTLRISQTRSDGEIESDEALKPMAQYLEVKGSICETLKELDKITSMLDTLLQLEEVRRPWERLDREKQEIHQWLESTRLTSEP